jgi:hypothetical protein
MPRSKETPDRSRIVRAPTTAYAKRQRPGTDSDQEDEAEVPPAKAPEIKPAGARADARPTEPDYRRAEDLSTRAPDLPEGDPTEHPELQRARTDTVLMPDLSGVGRPPEMPTTTAPPPLAQGNVEDPTHMPGPREIPAGTPDDPASPPGLVPPGDSRSLRRFNQFALIYRIETYVISRWGTIGTRGQWRVVEYPTSAAASHSYAKECSRFVSEGFSDYRE